jgi:hypothetical protein
MRKFRKKPVEVEAWQWFPEADDGVECETWCGGVAIVERFTDRPSRVLLIVQTLEGELAATPGDWIIRGAQGEFYPCKPDIFAATYEAVSDQGSENRDF